MKGKLVGAPKQQSPPNRPLAFLGRKKKRKNFFFVFFFFYLITESPKKAGLGKRKKAGLG